MTEEMELKDMPDGETGYTTPWGMYTDKNGKRWLIGNYLYLKESKGTFTLKVTRESNLFIVDTSLCKNEGYNYISKEDYFVGEFVPLEVQEIQHGK